MKVKQSISALWDHGNRWLISCRGAIMLCRPERSDGNDMTAQANIGRIDRNAMEKRTNPPAVRDSFAAHVAPWRSRDGILSPPILLP